MIHEAIVISSKDNVATAIKTLLSGESVICTGKREKIVVADEIPKGHKFATKNIYKGEHVYKYGQIIGTATAMISKGEHVHVHNIESERGRGDRK
jgi:altronate dehydratase small subunit